MTKNRACRQIRNMFYHAPYIVPDGTLGGVVACVLFTNILSLKGHLRISVIFFEEIILFMFLTHYYNIWIFLFIRIASFLAMTIPAAVIVGTKLSNRLFENKLRENSVSDFIF